MKLDKRRRRENKTNYNKRLILLKGESPRLVIRKTNKYIILQIIQSIHAQDKILYSVNTRELLKMGWPESKKGSLKSLGAAYAAGMVLGNKAKDIKERVVADTGLIPSTKGSRVYAAIKGIADSGIEINYKAEMAPSKEMIEGDNSKIINDITTKLGGKKK